MSSVMNKITNALTGHHNNTTTATGNNATGLHGNNAALPAGAAATGAGAAGTNYSATNNGALKEGAQVRDTGLAGTHSAAYNSYNNDSAARNGSNLTGTGAGLATGAALGSQTGSSTYSQQSSTMNTGMYGNNTSALGREEQNLRRDEQALLGREQQVGVAQGDIAMTRHEEHLLVGKEKINAGTAQLNKYVTTEKVGTAVPIMKEHAVIEREAVTTGGLAVEPNAFQEQSVSVRLMEERAVAEKEAVAIEKVHLRKEVEQTQQYVEAELRKEHIEIVDPTMASKSLNSTSTSSTLGRNSLDNSSSRNL